MSTTRARRERRDQARTEDRDEYTETAHDVQSSTDVQYLTFGL